MLECLKRSYEEHIVELQRINEDLTCEMMERNTILKAKKTALVEQSDRLASVSGEFFELEATRRQLKDQVEDLSCKNAAVKAECDSLRERYRRQDLEFRWAAERGLELLKSIMRLKVEAAEHRNEKNERVKQGRLSKELKKATRRPVDIGIEPEEGKEEELKMRRTSGPDPESREKPWRRPFRSASATSMTLTRYVDVFKGLFDFRLKRGNSVSSPSEDHYCRLSSCVAACLPSVVSDAKEAHLSEINAIKFSPNSSMVATGGTDRLVRLWNVAGGRLEHTQMLEGATGGITSLDFDPSGYHVLGASYNNVAQLWKIGDGKCRRKENDSCKQRKENDSYKQRKENDSYKQRREKERDSHKQRKENDSYKQRKENDSCKQRKENDSCKQRKENDSYKQRREKERDSHKQRKENDSYKQRKENDSCKQRKENDSCKQRKENDSYKQRKENDSYKQRREKERDSHKQRKENDSYKQRRENDSYKQRKENDSYKQRREKGRDGHKQNCTN
ncbi:UNVERIFIED_CONTAM: hypothetical protein K2H54_072512 [Gekko kuhli]